MNQSRLVDEPGNGRLEIFDLPTDTETLRRLLTDIFENYWDRIHFGSAVQGGVFEIRAPNPPREIRYLDGYLTVDFGHWHFHLCIGEHKGTSINPASADLAQHRRTARAELYRRLRDHDRPSSWGLRLFNGKAEQQMTVFLPNPYLSDEQQILKEPVWEHLDLWNHLRADYLGLPPDPKDLTASRIICG
ncbi:MAG: hypothetical protein N838_20140 [Thiohalocapsa sp. PB-PSB1]|jgi:hypothetical protein|nr:MAG: hypothetical protein N838_34985 [Thiohalocapsa sp. PB-PSB1]QQO55315.1 MAG: hypothetical protein N838_20140 [Thiohalocapsa sp. PB-PSB1]HCS91606.1 hypothetical protein [Chromatiaceae bacterium]